MRIAMGSRSGNTPGAAPRTSVHEAENEAQSVRPSPAMVLQLAVWIGLATGFLDLGLVILKRHLIDDDFYRLGHGFPWIIPTGVAALVVLPGAALALIAGLRRGGISLAIAVGLP